MTPASGCRRRRAARQRARRQFLAWPMHGDDGPLDFMRPDQRWPHDSCSVTEIPQRVRRLQRFAEKASRSRRHGIAESAIAATVSMSVALGLCWFAAKHAQVGLCFRAQACAAQQAAPLTGRYGRGPTSSRILCCGAGRRSPIVVGMNEQRRFRTGCGASLQCGVIVSLADVSPP